MFSSFLDPSNLCCFTDDHQTKDGRTVLLSSTLGISRSVTVAIAYYMWNKKVSLKVKPAIQTTLSCPRENKISRHPMEVFRKIGVPQGYICWLGDKINILNVLVWDYSGYSYSSLGIKKHTEFRFPEERLFFLKTEYSWRR